MEGSLTGMCKKVKYIFTCGIRFLNIQWLFIILCFVLNLASVKRVQINIRHSLCFCTHLLKVRHIYIYFYSCRIFRQEVCSSMITGSNVYAMYVFLPLNMSRQFLKLPENNIVTVFNRSRIQNFDFYSIMRRLQQEIDRKKSFLQINIA